MDNTVIQQGRFTSTGSNVTLQIRSGIDWMKVYNYTQFANGTGTGQVIESYWQNGMAQGTGLVWTKTATTLATVGAALASGGFFLVDSSVQTPGLLQATITAISNATIPVVTNTGTNGLLPGSVVKLINVAGAQQVGGIDFTVGNNTLSSTTFSLDYMATIVAGTTGSFRQVYFDPIFYPRKRTITKISKATQAVVTLSVTHGYTVGQLVRMHVPAEFGMTEMDGLSGTIVAINTTTTTGNTITLDIDSTAFTTFAWPVSSNLAFTPAECVPYGEDTAFATANGLDVLDDATINQSYIGMILSGGAGSPAGAASDVIYWVAGSSLNVDNE